MHNKEFKKGIAVGAAATLIVTGAGFVGYQKTMFPKGTALAGFCDCSETELSGESDR